MLRVLTVTACCLLLLSACLPSDPYARGYVVARGGRPVLRFLQCDLASPDTFKRVALYRASDYDQTDFRYTAPPMWEVTVADSHATRSVQRPSSVVIGADAVPGMRTVRRLGHPLDGSVRYLVSYRSIYEGDVEFRVADIGPGEAASDLGVTEESKLQEKRVDFGCVNGR